MLKIFDHLNLWFLFWLQDEDLEVVNVQTAENEKYQCVIPESQASKDAVSVVRYYR